MLKKQIKEETMKSKNALTLILAAFMVFALAYSTEARPFGRGLDDGKPDRALGQLQTLLALKLTDAQQEQLNNIISKYEDQGKNYRTEMRAARRNVWAALNTAPFDETNARAAYQSASAIREEMFILRAKMLAELKSVLTPEQLNQLKERKARDFRPTEHGPNSGPQNRSE
jgi:Spy/CpxP family protein refolding chaperone